MSLKIAFICLIVMSAAVARAVPDEVIYPCPTMYNPVCGSDGNTYPNSVCMINKDPTLTVKHDGNCEGDVEFVPR
ncbi:serine protease inhibitor Kazal-type 1-like [Epargyreus clarus]|uniref:serine protease inhibitor Kazal-type 1-like n=1 Tax=Epargyreus clarus TaxID=520877 RepID=UPI003C2DBC74